jgi:hypothetical protein
MTRQELLRYYQNEDYKDYVGKYLVKHWKDESNRNDWEALVNNNFANRHSVEGTLTKEKAVDVCRERSHEGTIDFTSTSLSTDFVERIVRYIATDIIEWHGKNRGEFTNYEVSAPGMMITVQSKAGQGYLHTQYRDKVVVGISREGLITHFHGDATYADGAIYGKGADNVMRRIN